MYALVLFRYIKNCLIFLSLCLLCRVRLVEKKIIQSRLLLFQTDIPKYSLYQCKFMKSLDIFLSGLLISTAVISNCSLEKELISFNKMSYCYRFDITEPCLRWPQT